LTLKEGTVGSSEILLILPLQWVAVCPEDSAMNGEVFVRDTVSFGT
jgi:hypothetical protein